MTVVGTGPRGTHGTGEARQRLPVVALLALAMTGFTAILTETLPAGLLPQISRDLGVTNSLAGQLVTLYAIGSLVAALPLTMATEGWRRKPVLLLAIGGLLVFNTATALLHDYTAVLVARFLAGVAAGLAWGMLVGYARAMVVDELKGKALALAMIGTPVALSLGVPLGAWLGSSIGWRGAFLVTSVTIVGLVAWVIFLVPDHAGRAAGKRVSLGRVFVTPGIRPVLATTFAWMVAHNVLYTYVAPLVERAGLVSNVDAMLLAFGLMALVGVVAAGVLVDRRLRALVLWSLLLFAAMTLALGLAGDAPAVVVAAVLLWGLSFGGAGTLLNTAAGDAAGEGVDLSASMITTVWNAAIAAGGALGGLLLDAGGIGLLPWAALIGIVVAFAVACNDHRHAFVSGRRRAATV